MSEDLIATDDQSHYEISLTAGQAFLAFVLLLLSLAASFAFGLMIGKGQADERLVVRKEPAVIQEGSATPSKRATEGRIVDLGGSGDDFKASAAKPAKPGADGSGTMPVIAEGASPAPAATNATEAAPVAVAQPKETPAKPVEAAQSPVVTAAKVAPAIPHYAQLLSTGDQKTAEALAAKLINGGFTSAYVERGATEKGPIFRVRIRFPSEADARAAEARLHEYSKDVWITK
jgi:septal ring-binding cell division protein DamX